MRMTSDHKICSLIEQELCKVFLIFVLCEHILNPPMHSDHHNFGACSAGRGNLAGHTVAVDDRHLHSIARLDSVSAVGVIKETDFESFYILYERNELLALYGIIVSADMIHSDAVESSESASRGFHPAVETMVVGGEEEIETCIAQCLRI